MFLGGLHSHMHSRTVKNFLYSFFISGVFLFLTNCTQVHAPLIPHKNTVEARVQAVGCGDNSLHATKESLSKLAVLLQLSPKITTEYLLENFKNLGIFVRSYRKSSPSTCVVAITTKHSLLMHGIVFEFKAESAFVATLGEIQRTDLGRWKEYIVGKNEFYVLEETGLLVMGLEGYDPASKFTEAGKVSLDFLRSGLTFSYAPHTPERLKRLVTPELYKMGIVYTDQNPTFELSGLLRRTRNGDIGSVVLKGTKSNQILVVWGGRTSGVKETTAIFLSLLYQTLRNTPG